MHKADPSGFLYLTEGYLLLQWLALVGDTHDHDKVLETDNP